MAVISHGAAKGRYKGSLEERIRAASPPSAALDAILEFFEKNAHTFELQLPTGAFQLAKDAAAAGRISVRCEPRRTRAIIGGHYDKLELRWNCAVQGHPAFQGTLTILPYGGATELLLRGHYDPPLGRFGAAFDSWAGNRLARATAKALLEQLRDALEENIEALTRAVPSPIR